MHAVLGGLDLNVLEASGVKWTTQSVEGWGGTGSSIAVANKPRSAGAWAGNGYAQPRHLSIGGLVRASTEDAVSAAFDRLNEAVGFDDTLLTITEGSRSRWCMVRRTDEVLRSDLSPTVAKWSVQVVALDPRKHGAPITASTRLPSSSGGLTIPYTIPYSINSTQVTGQVSIVNPGNETGPVTMRINGPCTGPVITHIGSGLRLVFAASMTLGAGEWSDIDHEAHTVLAQGTTTRAQYVTSRQWSGLEPGQNTWSFTAATYSAGALLTVTGTPADK